MLIKYFSSNNNSKIAAEKSITTTVKERRRSAASMNKKSPLDERKAQRRKLVSPPARHPSRSPPAVASKENNPTIASLQGASAWRRSWAVRYPAWAAFSKLLLMTTIALMPAMFLWFCVDRKTFDVSFLPPSSAASTGSGPTVPWLRQIFRWSVISAAGFFAYYATLVLVHLLPTSISRVHRLTHAQHIPTDILEPLHEGAKQLLGLRRYIAGAVSMLAMTAVVVLVLGGANVVDDEEAALKKIFESAEWTAKCFKALTIISIVILVEKAAVQRIAAFFHSSHYRERVEQNNFAMHVMHKLKDALNVTLASILGGEQPGRRERKVSVIRASGVHEAVHRDSLYTGGLEKKLISDVDEEDLSGLSNESILAIANAMFDALVGIGGSDEVTYENFAALLSKGDDAAQFFAFLDIDDNGSVSRKEWTDGITRRIFDERDMIVASLTANSSVIERIDRLMLAIALGLSPFYWLPVFDASLTESLFTFVSALYAASFLFESAVSGTAMSMMFLLFTHPFDVGDVIVVEGTWYSVVDIGLAETVLCGPTNQLTYVSNLWLADSIISNYRRSTNTVDTLSLPIDTHCRADQILLLESLVVKYMQDEAAREWIAKEARINNLRIVSADIMNVDMEVRYRGSLMEGVSKDERWSGLMRFVRDRAIKQTDLKLAPFNWDT